MGLFSLEMKRLKKVNLVNIYRYLKRGCKADGTRFFSVVPGQEAVNFKLKHRRFLLNIRKQVFLL